MVLDLIQRDAEHEPATPPPPRAELPAAPRPHRPLPRGRRDEGAPPEARGRSSSARSTGRGIVGIVAGGRSGGFHRVVVAEDLQWDFSLHQALSLFVVTALERLDPASPTYAVDVVTVVESILEDPDIVLRKQTDRAKGKLVEELKAEGVPYEERMAKLEEVTHPKPLADFLYGTFDDFRDAHPWAAGSDVEAEVDRPRDVRDLRRLLRLRAALRPRAERGGPPALPLAALQGARPDRPRGRQDRRAVGRPRLLPLPRRRDRRQPARGVGEPAPPRAASSTAGAPERRKEATWLEELLANPRVFAARVRAEMHLLVRALARKDWEEAAERVWQPPEPAEPADGRRRAVDARALRGLARPLLRGARRASGRPRVAPPRSGRTCGPSGPRRWEVTQTLLDPEGDNPWAVFADVDLRDRRARRPDLEGGRIGN